MAIFKGREDEDSKQPTYELDQSPSPSEGLTPANGTLHDARDMSRLGKKQEFQRNFRFLSILGFTCTVMSTWESMLCASSLALLNGGLAGAVWTFLGTIFCFTAVIASMADMSSMAPTIGGQYHWVSEFAPKSKQRFLSYMVGWTSLLGWQAGTASSSYIGGTMIQGLIVLNYPSYEPTRWQGTLFVIALVSVATLVNTYGARHLPLLEGLILLLHLVGFFAILIPLWVLAPINSPSVVFGQFYNGGGWPSIGTACIIGQLTSVFAFLGPDAAVHMAEEVRDASKIVPRCMISTVVLNGIMGFVMIITFCFCITDLPAALKSNTGYPFIDVFYAATNSKAGTTVMASILIVLSTCCCIAFLATASRHAFAFARDNGLPYALFWRKVTKLGVEIPLNAILGSLSITLILAVINIASTAAFNSIVGLLVAADFSSYLISISCILLKRLRGEPMLPSRWSMGRLAIPVNILAVVYLAFVLILSFFPASVDGLTPETMNWSVLVWGAVIVFALILYYVKGRKVYQGPVVYVRRDL